MSEGISDIWMGLVDLCSVQALCRLCCKVTVFRRLPGSSEPRLRRSGTAQILRAGSGNIAETGVTGYALEVVSNPTHRH